MINVVLPVFMVILIGFWIGKNREFPQQADKLINEYVLYIALPALLFLALARATPNEIYQWKFVITALAGIAFAYCLGLCLSYFLGIRSPNSSIVAMGTCYGTTGYMGVPILLAAFGEKAAAPAAVATILHNIPAILAVILTFDLFSPEAGRPAPSLAATAKKITKTVFGNPLTIAVIAGSVCSLMSASLPDFIVRFAGFLGAAAGPTALFALGLGLARLKVSDHVSLKNMRLIIPILVIKLFIQPVVTFAIGYFVFNLPMGNILLITP